MVCVRFAPSPTGYLHIGGARTALFNWLYAKHFGGTFKLRIEDTDRERSTPEAVQAILDSLNWLGLHHDGEVVFQSERAERHSAVAHDLVKAGKAYYCYCSPEKVEKMREDARANGLPPRYDGTCRDLSLDLSLDQAPAASEIPPVIRFKAPKEGETIIEDLVQGRVSLKNNQTDDLVLLRSNGAPTYMLSVIVDDHDMDITHIIRGDDHLTNAFRQKQIYEALGWKVPEFAHIPLIHGPDGAKLSKRHGALGAEQYRDMGYLPEALLNYLLRLGWAHGDDEIIDIQKAIEWFDLPAVGRSPSRMDFTKLNHLNGHYIRHFEGDAVLFDLVKPFIESLLARPLSTTEQGWIQNGIKGLKERAKTLLELADGALIYTDPLPAFDENTNVLRTSETTEHVTAVKQLLTPIQSDFTVENIEARIRQFCKDQNLKLGALSQSLRLALTHRTISPSLFDVMAILGWDETKKRFDAYLNSNAN